MHKYTSYRVDVRPATTMGQPIDMMATQSFTAVLRRYSDFLWLYEKLHQERAGAIVPPLPEKQPVGRFSPAFVEDRRRALERFLRRVSVHPELNDAKCLDSFLRADDVTFQAAKHSKGDAIVLQQSQYGGGGGGGGAYPQQNQQQQQQPMMFNPTKTQKPGFKRWFAETKTSMTGDLVKSPDDELFDEINRYIHGLDNQMKNVTTQASGLVRKGKEIANGMFEFGLAFNLLGQSEADALGDALTKMGETADKLSVLSADHADQEAQHFEDPLVDTIKIIHAVKLALQRRHEKRLTYSTCLQEVESKQSQLAKLRAQMGMEAKAYAAEMSLRRAQDAAQVARDDFATVSQRVLREVDRFKREKAEDMRTIVLQYIQLQVEYNKRMEQVWATLIPQLEQVQLDQNANVVGGSGIPQMRSGAPLSNASSGQHQQQPQIHSQPMIPNPQQAMQQQQQEQQGGPFYAAHQQQPPQIIQPPQPPHQDPMMSVQYREAPTGF
jgi:sorting nexin-1/2